MAGGASNWQVLPDTFSIRISWVLNPNILIRRRKALKGNRKPAPFFSTADVSATAPTPLLLHSSHHTSHPYRVTSYSNKNYPISPAPAFSMSSNSTTYMLNIGLNALVIAKLFYYHNVKHMTRLCVTCNPSDHGIAYSRQYFFFF